MTNNTVEYENSIELIKKRIAANILNTHSLVLQIKS